MSLLIIVQNEAFLFIGLINSTLTDDNQIGNCLIENTVVADTLGITNSSNAVGLELNYCYNILAKFFIWSCKSRDFRHPQDAIGVLVESGTNVVFNNCDASGNYGEAAYGFKISGTTVGQQQPPAHLLNALQMQILDLIQAPMVLDAAFYADTVNGCVWEKCQANGNQGTSVGYGFFYDTVNYSSNKKNVQHLTTAVDLQEQVLLMEALVFIVLAE